MNIQRARQGRTAVISFLLVGLAGCGPVDDLNEPVATKQSALTILPGEFSRNTPTHIVQESVDSIVTLNGNGYDAFDTISYSHVGSETGNADEIGQYGLGALGGHASYRPFVFWEDAEHQATTILASDLDRGDTVRDPDQESTTNPSASLVNPAFALNSVLGPTVALHMADGHFCAFTLYDSSGSRVIAQSCLQGSPGIPNHWDDWGLELPSVFAPTLTPNLSPMVFRRTPEGSAGSDSLSYPCGAGATQICEYRIGGAGAAQTFTTNFGSGSFMANTRPTAISNGFVDGVDTGNFTKPNPDRWIFAAKVDGNVRSVVARRETSDANSGAQPTYNDSHGNNAASVTVESTTANVTYSTPMPYVRSDLKTAIVYYRTDAGYTTRVMESVCSPSGMDSTCTAPVAIYDVGMQIPAGNEPVPYVELPVGSSTSGMRNTVIIRLPYSGGVDDIGLLQQGPIVGDGYTKMMLPPAFSGSGFNVIAQGSAFDDSAWTKLNVADPMAAANIDTQAIIAPNATYTAELLRETSATGTHGVSQSAYSDTRTFYRWTAYLRAETRTAAQLVMTSDDDPSSALSVSVNLTAGTVTATSATGRAVYVGSAIESMGTTTGAKWYRVSVFGNPTTAAGNSIVGKILMMSGSNTSYAGNTADGLFVWGAELMHYDQTAPLPPTGLGATAGNAQVALSWTASAGATSYNIYRGTSANGESATAIATGITPTTYTSTGLTNGTKYYYKVAAVNASGTSFQSTEASATPVAPAPSAPTGLGATAGNAQVVLAWTASAGATTYNVYRSTTAGGEGTTAVATGITPTTYTNTGLTNGTKYYFKVAAVNASGTSGQSNEASATPVGAAPSAPTGLGATAGNAQVVLAWTASAGATTYNVYRSTTAGGEGTTAIATGITPTTYTNTGLTNGTKYYFKVAAVNASGTSGQSNEASATPVGAAPSAPTGLGATAGNAQVVLAWTASAGATTYNVYRSTTAGGEGTTAIATGITPTTYTNTGLTNGTKYYFKVAAVNASGTSGQSNEASATPVASTTISINCGGAATGSWLADTGTGGSAKSWTNTVDTSLLTGTIPPQTVLQHGLVGKTLTYTFTGLAANSTHTFTMYFVENFFKVSGSRIFSVTDATGAVKISALDIYVAAGNLANGASEFRAVQKSFTAKADGTGKIVLTLAASKDNASVEGIVVQ